MPSVFWMLLLFLLRSVLFVLRVVSLPVGVAAGLAVIVAFAPIIVVHWISFGLCRLGAHAAGCWIRRNMTRPVLALVTRACDWRAKLVRQRGAN